MPSVPDPYMLDDENPELTEADFARMRPVSEVLPPALYARLLARSEASKSGKVEAVVIHLDPETAARLRADGPGWEDRAGDIPREAVGL